MIELCSDDISFMITKQADMVSVYKYLTEYMGILGSSIISLDPTHEFVRYYKKCTIMEKVILEMATQAGANEVRNNAYTELPQLSDMIKML